MPELSRVPKIGIVVVAYKRLDAGGHLDRIPADVPPASPR